MAEPGPEVIARASQGDVAAFEEIYRVHSALVYGIALRMLGRVEDAEEVVQDVFVAAHKGLKGFCGQSSLRTWLYRIAVNMSLNALRRRKRRRRELPMAEDMDFADPKNQVREEAEREMHQATIDGVLEGLNPDQRACLILRAQEGLSYEDIASMLRININTVRTRLKRAREAAVKIAAQRRAG